MKPNKNTAKKRLYISIIIIITLRVVQDRTALVQDDQISWHHLS